MKNSAKNTLGIRIVCMSDLHNIPHDFTVPDGDILIVAGDICGIGNEEEIKDFDEFLAAQNHSAKLVIAGNHDFLFEDYSPENARKLLKHAIYLEDDGIDIYGIKFWGSPWQPYFGGWAFNLPRGPRLASVWEKIPADTDVLITHTPPYGTLDVVNGEHVGCRDLSRALKRIRPRLHVFGHIHQGYGMTERNGTIYVNSSLRDDEYQLVNQPIVVDL